MTFLEHVKRNKYTIYCDMDGVLVWFDKMFKSRSNLLDRKDQSPEVQEKVWKFLGAQDKTFWSEMEWMPDGSELWDFVKDLDTKICSTPVRNDASKVGKLEWCEKNLGKDVPVILTEDKEEYAGPTHILIDDRESNIDKWVANKGIGILHKNTKESIRQLKEIFD